MSDKIKGALFAAAILLAACGSPKDGWELVWSEDFSDPVIDLDNWSRIPWGSPDWQNMMAPGREDLAFVEDGQLVLLGKNNDGTTADTTEFVTGGIWSAGKKSFRLARFEIRAKFNSVKGFWSAIWLLPDDGVAYPHGGEIDIMEHLNSETIAYQTVHSYYSLNVCDSIPKHNSTAVIDPSEWNVYAVEIHKDSVCFFTNEEKTLTYPKVEGLDEQFPYSDHPFYLILSNQLGGAWVGEVAPEQLPSELRIDWVKVYQRKED